MALESYQFFLEINSFLYKSTYVQGVPNLNTPFKLNFRPEKKSIIFTDENKNSKFEILRENLLDIYVEDQSSIESRISLSRLLLVGVFAFAWKKRSTNPLSFIIFEYKNDMGSAQQMIIQSDSKNSFQYFTNVKYNLLKFWKEIDENPDIVQTIEIKKKEHQIKQDESNKKFRNGCLFLVVAFLVFILFLFTKK